jgi:hypothetical protein
MVAIAVQQESETARLSRQTHCRQASIGS